MTEGNEMSRKLVAAGIMSGAAGGLPGLSCSGPAIVSSSPSVLYVARPLLAARAVRVAARVERLFLLRPPPTVGTSARYAPGTVITHSRRLG